MKNLNHKNHVNVVNGTVIEVFTRYQNQNYTARIGVKKHHLPVEKQKRKERWMITDCTKNRHEFIGGSDIAGIMNMSRWETPLSVWAKKTQKDKRAFKMNEAVEFGTLLEPVVAKKWADVTGNKIRNDSRDFTHEDYPYMKAHIDRWVVRKGILECKTCSSYKSNEWEDDKVPDEYVLQVNWYLGIVKKKRGYIAVLIGGQKFVHKEIEFSQKLFDQQIAAAKDFWENYVLTGVMPFASSEDKEVLGELFQDHDEIMEVIGGDREAIINEICLNKVEGSAQAKEIKKGLEETCNKLRRLIGENLGIETSEYEATWKKQKQSRLDLELLRDQYEWIDEMLLKIKRADSLDKVREYVDKMYPMLMAKCHKTTESRVLRVKTRKDAG